MPDTRQLAEDVAAELGLSVTQVGQVLRAEHLAIQRRLAAGERVVLTGFVSIEGDEGRARFIPGTTLRRVMRGEPIKRKATVPTVQVTDPKKMARRQRTTDEAAGAAKRSGRKATTKKTAAAKKTTAKKTTAKTAAKKAPAKKTAAKTAAKKAPAKKTTTRKRSK